MHFSHHSPKWSKVGLHDVLSTEQREKHESCLCVLLYTLYHILTILDATVHPMVEVLRESVRGRPKSQQADERLCCIEALTAACDVWHHSQRGGNNESESNSTPTTALRQMGG